MVTQGDTRREDYSSYRGVRGVVASMRKMIAFWGLHWAPPIYENYYILGILSVARPSSIRRLTECPPSYHAKDIRL